MDKINKGEIVFCNIEIQYTKLKRTIKKKFNRFIFSRFYDCIDYPNIDIIKYYMLINKLDKKNANNISNVKIVDLNIIARTGYKTNFKKK
jgi:hypothetical protein